MTDEAIQDLIETYTTQLENADNKLKDVVITSTPYKIVQKDTAHEMGFDVDNNFRLAMGNCQTSNYSEKLANYLVEKWNSENGDKYEIEKVGDVEFYTRQVLEAERMLKSLTKAA